MNGGDSFVAWLNLSEKEYEELKECAAALGKSPEKFVKDVTITDIESRKKFFDSYKYWETASRKLADIDPSSPGGEEYQEVCEEAAKVGLPYKEFMEAVYYAFSQPWQRKRSVAKRLGGNSPDNPEYCKYLRLMSKIVTAMAQDCRTAETECQK